MKLAVIGFGGVSCGGKTTLAKLLAKKLQVRLFKEHKSMRSRKLTSDFSRHVMSHHVSCHASSRLMSYGLY